MPLPPHVGIQGVERGLGRAVPVPRPALAEGGKGGLWEQSCGGRTVDTASSTALAREHL